MRVDLDAQVRTSDGSDGGTVQRVIVDPSTNQVQAFVVRTPGLAGHEVLLPEAEVEGASDDGNTLRARLTRDQIAALEPFLPDEFMAPPAGWTAPPAFDLPEDAYVWPASYAGTTPTMAATSEHEDVAEAGPATLAGALASGEHQAGQGEGLVDVPKGTPVYDRAGENVGVVDDVRFAEDTGQLMGLVLRAGGTLQTFFGGGATVELGSSAIDRIGGDGVYLRVTRDEVRRQAAGRT
jgi:sporulation protein YlmC with PRC-barrel domain